MKIIKKKANKNGFTLIELLVVIAILGLLASLIMVAMNSARGKARDAKRMADLRQFSAALDMFHTEYGKYPCGDSFDAAANVHQDGTSSCPFLDGNAASDATVPYTYPCPGGHANNDMCADYPTFGLKTAGLISVFDFRSNVVLHNYGYIASVDRQKYLLTTTLESNISAMQNDGGLCSKKYEVSTGAWSTSELPFWLSGANCN